MRTPEFDMKYSKKTERHISRNVIDYNNKDEANSPIILIFDVSR